ncbi:hypothetical protein PF001_g23546 [Phytophthora fragariae]|uniref:RxLR effector protein n=1 Tax=Phytophthora fragariae TaxID=53985 RepID=A0A6A4C0T0_9STRA|nr:hypothetical protein PF001_g23546 [Phytophthora fragariae]
MFSLSNSSKIFALCVAAAAGCSGVHAENEAAETFGLLGVPGYGYGAGPAVSVGVPGLASVGVGLGNGGVGVGANVLSVGVSG